MRMKKTSLLIAFAALLSASCSKVQTVGTGGDGGSVEVTVNVRLQNEEQPRATWDDDGNAALVDHWIMEVYDAGGNLFDRQEKSGQSGLSNNFSVILIKSQSYSFAFWADKEGSYDTAKLTEVKTVSNVAGLDSRDAFFAKMDYTPDMGTSVSARLYRPFAQINVVTLDLKNIYDQMAAAGTEGDYANYEPRNLKLSCETYNQFDVLTGAVSNAQSTELSLASCYADFSAHAETTTIFMDYLFAAQEKELKNLTFTFESNGVAVDYDFDNIPLQRNYRTNISGNLLCNDTQIQVVIEPDWLTPENDVIYP